jgi:hypothetical protein
MVFSAITVFDAFGVPVILRYTMHHRGTGVPVQEWGNRLKAAIRGAGSHSGWKISGKISVV